MNKALILFLLLFAGLTAAEAQMNTDNSYLRRNYEQSKTAKKAAEKKARKQALKDAKAKDREQKKAQKEQGKIYYNATPKPAVLQAETPAPNDNQYLEGAVPTTAEGVVCFERTFTSENKSGNQIFDILKEFADEKIEQTDYLEISRVLSESKDTLVASVCEPMYFKRKKWEADSTLIQYQYLATVKDNSATLRIWFISYCYEQSQISGFNYKAEEWITDKYALSKDKRSLLKLPGKFRTKTIEYINNIFDIIDQRIK